MWPAWRASRRGGWVNVSYTRPLMRPETKERADTTVGSVLRGSFTFYQATAGDVEEGGMRREREEGERRRKRLGKKGCFQFASFSQKKKLFQCLSWATNGRSLECFPSLGFASQWKCNCKWYSFFFFFCHSRRARRASISRHWDLLICRHSRQMFQVSAPIWAQSGSGPVTAALGKEEDRRRFVVTEHSSWTRMQTQTNPHSNGHTSSRQFHTVGCPLFIIFGPLCTVHILLWQVIHLCVLL